MIEIAGRPIGHAHPCLTIAEIGSNHNGDFEQAKRLIGLAAESKADAVKFQSFSAEGLVNRRVFDEQRSPRPNPVFEVLQRLALPLDWHAPLKEEAERRGLIFISTPFDQERLDLLLELDVAAIKLASGDLTHYPLLARAARSGKPILLSTGMATAEEIGGAVSCLRDAGGRQLVLLHCVSQYPSRTGELNLNVLRDHFGVDGLDCPLGLSDHSPGHEAVLAARALGACVIEKHFTPSRDLPTPDAPFAMEPDEFRRMVEALRRVESALGTGEKKPTPGELEELKLARRSVCAAQDIGRGDTLTESMVKFRRPATGISPGDAGQILGRRAACDISEDEILRVEWFE